MRIGLTVDAKGHPNDIWIIRAAGLGLDFNAAETVRQYIFSPATCHGTAVPVSLYIDVAYQTF
ncbi:MAG: energy transducer TonB [Acidobacteriota bacterium]|nr:energy transducer TonB [Acidobacteriota bacterium]